jgi:hypothetical protein
MARIQHAAIILLRVPPALKNWVAAQADYNLTSMNAEVVKAIRAHMAATEQRETEAAR